MAEEKKVTGRWQKFKTSVKGGAKATKRIAQGSVGAGSQFMQGMRGGGIPPTSAYMPSTAGNGGGGGGLAHERIQKLIYIIISVIIVVFTFLFISPLFGMVAAVFAFLAFLVYSGFGSRLVASKYFPIIAAASVIIVVLLFILYFVFVGGPQAISGVGYQTETGIGAIFQSFAFKSLRNFVENPFGINPIVSDVEKVQGDTVQSSQVANQAFSVSIRNMLDTVQFDQNAIAFVITVKNEGSARIEEMDVTVLSEQPKAGCLRFDPEGYPTSGTTVCQGSGNNKIKCTVTDIGPFAQKEIVITGASVSKSCVESSLFTSLKSGVETPIFINVQASTYYPTSSRLAVERIKSDYGVLLFQNNVLIPENRGAISRAGSAMTINLDIGAQPILDSVSEGGLIMNWIDTGSGQMDNNKNPFLFIVTPGNFGPCVASGLGSKSIVIKSLEADNCPKQAKSDALVCSSNLAGKLKDICAAAYCTEINIDTYNRILEELQNKEIASEETIDTYNRYGADVLNTESGPFTGCSTEYDDCQTRYVELAKPCFAEADTTYSECKNWEKAVSDEGSNPAETVCTSTTSDDEKDYKCILCDDALYRTWCDSNSAIYKKIETEAPNMKPVFDWVCEKANDTNAGWRQDQYHVCGTNALTEEFNVFTCSLELCDDHSPNYNGGCDDIGIQTNENRITQYITAVSLYPYKASTSTQVKAFFTE